MVNLRPQLLYDVRGQVWDNLHKCSNGMIRTIILINLRDKVYRRIHNSMLKMVADNVRGIVNR